MIGSLVFFGPALLYLLSPSARKNTHGVHNDHRDFPALKKHEGHSSESAVAVPVTETMKDDEGTEANVSSSMALSQVRIIYFFFAFEPRPGVRLNNYD